MYGKRRINNKPLYFIYAPPQTGLDRPNARLPALVRPEAVNSTTASIIIGGHFSD